MSVYGNTHRARTTICIYSLDARESVAPPILEASTNVTATLSFLSPFLISFYYFIYIVYKIEVQKHLETGCRTDRPQTDRSFSSRTRSSRRDVRVCLCVSVQRHLHTQTERVFSQIEHMYTLSSSHARTQSSVTRTERTEKRN